MEGPLVLAHRGWTRRAPENTLEAIQAAEAIGSHGAEFDVRVLRDGNCVLHHDSDVQLTDGRRPVATFTLAELRAVHPQTTTLAEVLGWVSEHEAFWLNVEIKAREALAPALRLLGKRTQRMAVTSFDLSVAAEAKNARRELRAGWISDEKRDDLARIAADAGLDTLVLHRSNARSALVADARARGLEVWAWGVNWGFQTRALERRGVTGFITDAPERLLRLR